MTCFTETREISAAQTERDVIFAFITTDPDPETKVKEVYVSHETATVPED